jgi:ribosome-binding factor A
MARQRRQERLAAVLQRAISEVLQREVSDPRVTAMVSVTRVEPAADLRSAKVFFSLFGEEAQQRTTWRALQHAHGRIQNLVGDRVDLRWTPELFFRIDESLKKALEVNRLIKLAMAEFGETEPASADDDGTDDADDAAEGDGGGAAEESAPDRPADGAAPRQPREREVG